MNPLIGERTLPDGVHRVAYNLDAVATVEEACHTTMAELMAVSGTLRCPSVRVVVTALSAGLESYQERHGGNGPRTKFTDSKVRKILMECGGTFAVWPVLFQSMLRAEGLGLIDDTVAEDEAEDDADPPATPGDGASDSS